MEKVNNEIKMEKNEMDKLRIAAESGVVEAQCELGLNYEEAEDYAQAAHWLTLAAEQGDALSQIWLGDLYLKGEGVEQSDEKVASLGWSL